MNFSLRAFILAPIAIGAAGAATAQSQPNVVKIGLTEYTTHSRTDGVTGVGVPPGADAQTGNAATVIFTYERMATPNIGLELVMGIPPRIKAKGTGSVAFLGDDVLSAKILAPTLFLNYHFGAPGDTWRPYLGAGANYTKFTSVQSKLAPDVKMSSSTGWAAQGGIEYAMNSNWSLFASVAALRVKSKVVASGVTVLQTTVDFRPIVYTAGVSYSF